MVAVGRHKVAATSKQEIRVRVLKVFRVLKTLQMHTTCTHKRTHTCTHINHQARCSGTAHGGSKVAVHGGHMVAAIKQKKESERSPKSLPNSPPIGH